VKRRICFDDTTEKITKQILRRAAPQNDTQGVTRQVWIPSAIAEKTCGIDRRTRLYVILSETKDLSGEILRRSSLLRMTFMLHPN
jgi:hypothetical protein